MALPVLGGKVRREGTKVTSSTEDRRSVSNNKQRKQTIHQLPSFKDSLFQQSPHCLLFNYTQYESNNSLDSIFLDHFCLLAPSPAQVVSRIKIIISGLWSHFFFHQIALSGFVFHSHSRTRQKKNHSFLCYLTSLLSIFSLAISQCCHQFTLNMQMPYIITLSFLFLYYFALPFLFTYLYSLCITQCYRSVSVSLRHICNLSVDHVTMNGLLCSFPKPDLHTWFTREMRRSSHRSNIITNFR